MGGRHPARRARLISSTTSCRRRSLVVAHDEASQGAVLDDAVAARMKRGEALFRSPSPQFFLVLDEWVLHRVVGGPGTMREQLGHLLELCERPNININVLPHDTEHYVAFSGGFTLLKVDGRPDVAYIEAGGLGNLIEEPRAVADCAVRFDLLRGHTHHAAESRRIIRKAMECL